MKIFDCGNETGIILSPLKSCYFMASSYAEMRCCKKLGSNIKRERNIFSSATSWTLKWLIKLTNFYSFLVPLSSHV